MKARTIGAVHTHTLGNLKTKKIVNIKTYYIYVILMYKNNINVTCLFFISRRWKYKAKNNVVIKF